MERAPRVPEAVLARTKLAEVARGLGDDVVIQTESCSAELSFFVFVSLQFFVGFRCSLECVGELCVKALGYVKVSHVLMFPCRK